MIWMTEPLAGEAVELTGLDVQMEPVESMETEFGLPAVNAVAHWLVAVL